MFTRLRAQRSTPELTHYTIIELGEGSYSETWITPTAGDHQKSLSYELCSPFALAMWPP